MINTNYANAYKEVLIVINNLVQEDYDKIPKEYIEFLENNANSDYDFKYDSSKSFDQQELLDDTKYILFGLFEKYGATEKQKLKIKAFKNNYNEKLDYEKRQKYNPDNIFNKKQNCINKTIKETMSNKETVAIVKYKKQKWYQQVFERLLNIFRKK